MGILHVQAVWLCCFMALVVRSQASTYDVMKFGAKANGKTDDSEAIAEAWKEACGSSITSVLVIPKGTYMVANADFVGPCRAPVQIHCQGTFKAPVDLANAKSHDGWVSFENVDRLTVSGGTFDGQGATAWHKNDCAKTGKCNSLPINMRFDKLTNSIIRDITSQNSKLFHMNVLNCNNVTFQHVTIDAPQESLNTDGIHIGRSIKINIIGANIKTGDDCVSLGDGSQKVTIEKVTCGPGHGISIGSLGRYRDEQPVIGITVRNCTISNTMNGVRVKTWPASPSGLAQDLHFEDIVMNNVSMPILIDQQYCPYGQCKAQVPSRVRISNISFKNIRGTSAKQLAVKLVCSRGIPCQNVELNNINLAYHGKNGAATSECANVKPKLIGQIFPPACAVSSH